MLLKEEFTVNFLTSRFDATSVLIRKCAITSFRRCREIPFQPQTSSSSEMAVSHYVLFLFPANVVFHLVTPSPLAAHNKEKNIPKLIRLLNTLEIIWWNIVANNNLKKMRDTWYTKVGLHRRDSASKVPTGTVADKTKKKRFFLFCAYNSPRRPESLISWHDGYFNGSRKVSI